MPFVIAIMGLAIVFLIVRLWGESLATTELRTEVRMLRERYEPVNKPDENKNQDN